MPLVPKDWKDSPDTTTPISAAALEDMEARLGAYADGVAGGIANISVAPDVDATTKQSGGAAIRARRHAWWYSSGSKLRFDGPAGICNVMDPYYGTCKRDGTGPSSANALAIINAILDAASKYNGASGNSGGGGGTVFFPAGTYLVDRSLLSDSNYHVEQRWLGEGPLSSIIKLDVEANLFAGPAPLVYLHQPQGGQPARFYAEQLMFRTSWTFGAASNFYSSEFPLVSIGSGDLSHLGPLFIWYAFGNGLEIGVTDHATGANFTFPNASKPSASDRWYIHGIHANLCKRHGVQLTVGAPFGAVLSGIEVSGNGGAGLYADGSYLNLGNLQVNGLQAEQCGDAAVYFKSVTNSHLRNVYAFQCPIVFDEDTTECSATECQPYDHLTESDEVEFFSYGGQVVDNGFNNIIGPNGGTGYPAPGVRAGKTIQQLMPSSRLPDGDMRQRALTGWTASGATATKGYNATEWRRSVSQAGGGSPMALLQSVAATPGGATATMPVVATECYLFEVIWSAASVTTTGVRVRVLNDADSAVIHSVPIQNIRGNRPPNADEVRPQLLRFIAKIPAGVTTARVEVFAAQASGGVGTHYIMSVHATKIPLLNANMQGFTATVLDNWAIDQTGGTLSQETTVVEAARGYANAARLHVNSASTFSIIQTVSPIDPRKFYLMRARYFIETGQADTVDSMRRRVKMRLGSFQGGGNFQQFGIRARKAGEWDDIMHIFKPGGTAVNSATRDKVSIGMTSGTAAMDLIVQEFYCVPLKDDVSLSSYVSGEITLSAAAPSVMVGVPTIDSVIRSITLVYTGATDANTGVTINVGTAATAGYYATLTSATNQAQDTPVDLTLLRTDLRAGVPIRLSSPGNKTGTGKVAIIVEYE